jgi:hypothetical protein
MGRTEYNVSTAAFVADPHSINRLPTGRQIDWDAIGDSYRDTAEIVKLSAAAAADDTTLAVDALPVAIPAGTNLYFGQAKEFARVTANAAAGATSLTVEALPSALEDNDEATIGGAGDKTIPAGTVMAALSSGKMVPRAARPGSETAIGILESAAVEGSKSAALSGYGVIIGGSIYENLLPEATGTPAVIDSTFKSELQTAGVGTGFAWFQYGDDTAS